MRIRLAMMRLGEMISVVRGAPDVVQKEFERSSKKAGSGEILCSVEGEPTSILEEDELWKELVRESHKAGYGDFGDKKFLVWRRKAGWFWQPNAAYDPLMVCYLTDRNETIIMTVLEVQVSNPSLN